MSVARRILATPLLVVALVSFGCGMRTDSNEGAAAGAGLAAAGRGDASSAFVGAPTPDGATGTAAESGSAVNGSATGGAAPAVSSAAGSTPATRPGSVPAAAGAFGATPPGAPGAGSNGRNQGAAPGSDPSLSRSEGAAPGRPANAAASVPNPSGPGTGARSPIVLGSVGEQTGIVGSFEAAIPRGVQVWIEATNANGGLNGHPLRYVVADDGGDPARHRALVQQLVEQKGVVAFVGMNAPMTGHASVAYLKEKRVPVIGTDGGSSWVYDSPMHFPQSSTTPAVWLSLTGALSQANPGKTKVGVLACVEAQGCEELYNDMPKDAAAFGLTLVYRARMSIGQPDFTAECVSARNAGVELMAMASDPNSFVRLARSCANVGFKPAWGAAQNIKDDVIAKEPLLDGFSMASPIRPIFLRDTPALAEFHDAKDRYAAGETLTVMFGMGWTAAKVFEHATRNIPDPTSSESILGGLWSLKNDDIDGLSYPLTFVKDQPLKPRACWYSLVLRSGKWTHDGAPMTCRDFTR